MIGWRIQIYSVLGGRYHLDNLISAEIAMILE
jgi:hypothetical protein